MATDLTPSVPITSIPPHSDDTPTSTIPAAITTKPVGFLAYTNGSTPIKRHTTTHLTPKHEPPPPRTMISTTTTTVSYKECMRNHAATIGGHALDGCCEFMPSPESNPAEPTSLVCAACGCHRNFHRRDPDDPTPLHQKHHPHPHPPPSHPHLNPRTPPPESPLPPPTSTFYSSAPHFHHHLTPLQNNNLTTAPSPVAMASAPPNGTRKLKLPLISDRGSGGDGSGRISRKRFRTKFTREQKERMQGFAERMGWKMQKIDRRVVEEFCEEIGVGREVLKVWMHNNKNVFVRNRDEISGHSHGLHNGSNNNNRQVTGGTTSTTTAVVGGGGGDKIIGNGGDRIIHGLFYSTSSSNGGDADGGGGAGVKVERMDMTVGRGGDDDDDGSGSGSGGSHRSNGVDRFEHFQVVSADGSASSSSSG